MTQNKSDEDIKQTVLNLAKQQGVNIDQLANQYGIKL